MSRFFQIKGVFGVISVFGLGLVVTTAGCSPDLGVAPFKCNVGSPQCPEGYECNAGNICVKEGTCPSEVPGCQTSSSCGDGRCNAQEGETCQTCEKDCGKCQPGCGDGECTAPQEDCGTCPADCGACPPVCGDDNCELPETQATCPQDCSSTHCGNGKCETGETVSNCPADCKAQPVCGDGKCELPETVSNCPADCKAQPVCGDGKCELPETSATCPQDCQPSCPTPDTKCKDADTLEYCEQGTWKTAACTAICTSGNYDYTSGCRFSSQSNKDVCICGKYSAFGEVCSAETKCQAGLLCVSLGSATKGFCTKTCTNVGGTCSGAGWHQADCSSQQINGQNICIFSCDLLISCPKGLTCTDPLFGGTCQP